MPVLEKTKYERFAQLVASQCSATKAAIIVGYSEKTADVQGCRLLKNVSVRNRVTELQEQMASNKIMTIKERKERLSEIAQKRNRMKGDPIRAIAELNKMEGTYEPERHTIDLKTDVTFIIGRGYIGEDVQPACNLKELKEENDADITACKARKSWWIKEYGEGNHIQEEKL